MPPLRHSDARPRLDPLGALLLIAGLVPVLLGLTWAGTLYPWRSPQTLALFGGGLSATALFAAHEVALERRGGEPILDPRLFANRAFTVSLLSIMVAFMGVVGGMAFLPLYAQGVLRVSATASGLVLTPMMIAILAGSTIAGAIAARTGAARSIAIAGMASGVVGGALLLRLNLQTGYGDMVVAIVALGLGIGSGFAIYGTLVMNALPAQRRGQGMACFDFFQELGGPIGLAILGPVLASRYLPAYRAALSPAVTRHVPAQIVQRFDKPDALLNPSALQALTAQLGPHAQATLASLLTAVKAGLAGSLHSVFMVSLVILVCGFAITLLLPRVDMREMSEDAGRTSGAEQRAA